MRILHIILHIRNSFKPIFDGISQIFTKCKIMHFKNKFCNQEIGKIWFFVETKYALNLKFIQCCNIAFALQFFFLTREAFQCALVYLTALANSSDAQKHIQALQEICIKEMVQKKVQSSIVDYFNVSQLIIRS